MVDDRPCHMDRTGIILVKMFDRMVRGLKNVRYVPQLEKQILSLLVP